MNHRKVCDGTSHTPSCFSVTRSCFFAWLLVLLFGYSALIPSNVQAQIRPFFCTPYKMVNGNVTGNIAVCDNKVVVYMGQPIPPKAEGAVGDTPIQLGMLTFTSEGKDTTIYLDAETTMSPLTGIVTIIPNTPFPMYEEKQGTAILYEVRVDCRWFGLQSTSGYGRFYFSKECSVHYRTEARLLTDGSLIPQSFTYPEFANEIIHPDSIVPIGADQSPEGYVFDHWTSSHPEISFVPKKSQQDVKDGCWPLLDTVMFTAWYSKATDVNEEKRNNELIEASWSPQSHLLTLDGLTSVQATITVYDVRGSTTYHGVVEAPRGQIQVQFSPLPGVHLVVVKQGTLVTTTHFLAY